MKLSLKPILTVLSAAVCLVLASGCGDDDSSADDGGTDAGLCDGVVCELEASCVERSLGDGGVVEVLNLGSVGSCDPNDGTCMFNLSLNRVDCEFGCIEQPGDDVCLVPWSEDFESGAADWSFKADAGTEEIELDGVTGSNALHMTSVAAVCSTVGWAEAYRYSILVPTTAKGLSFTLHGDVTEPYGDFWVAATGSTMGAIFASSAVGDTVETIILCIPPEQRGDTIDLRITVRGTGGSCVEFGSYQAWVDDLQFVTDSTGCVGELFDPND